MSRPRLLRLVRRYGVLAVGLAGVVGLVVVVNPAQVRSALTGADPGFLALMLPTVLLLYVAHGAAWWLALRGAAVPVGFRRAVRGVLVSQAFDVVPGGDLWRVPIVAQDGGPPAPPGPLAATVVFDDLVYFFVLSLAMLPAAARLPELRLPLTLALLPQLLIFVVLLWPRVYAGLAGRVGRLAPLRPYRDQLDALGPAFRRLMRPRTLVPVTLVDTGCAALAVGLYWLALLAVHARAIGIARAAFTYSATQVLSGLTVLPGALGAYEALSTGLLAALGAAPARAAAAALLYRVVNDLLMAVLGLALGVLVRRRAARAAPGLAAGVAKDPPAG